MAELKQVIRELKGHIEKGQLSGREFADAVVAAFEAIDQRCVEIEERLPPKGNISVAGAKPSPGGAIRESKG
jgi:hypothetical protein